jgi:Fe-Mn family superoxide dismutase
MTEYKIDNLPWGESDLEPEISAETISFHYGKHHKGYVKKLNAALALLNKDEVKSTELDDLIKEAKAAGWTKIYNCAAQHWNHTFYWNCMAKKGTKAIQDDSKIAKEITTAFGGVDKFKEAFCAAAGGLFGSGWAWLVVKDKKLEIVKTSNADIPPECCTPIMVCDVWEHAYYIDQRNNRGQYIENFWELINWEFVNKNYETAMGN